MRCKSSQGSTSRSKYRPPKKTKRCAGGYQPSLRACDCREARRSNEGRWKATATMHLSSWSKEGMKRADTQSKSAAEVVMHLQPPGGATAKSTPWRHAYLRRILQAARLAEKQCTSVLWCKRSNSSLSRLRICLTRTRKQPAAWDTEGLQPDNAWRSWRPVSSVALGPSWRRKSVRAVL